LDEYPKVFVVGADNVGSRQMQKIRVSLRGHAGKCELLFYIKKIFFSI
jgi:ribosomal protein L10